MKELLYFGVYIWVYVFLSFLFRFIYVLLCNMRMLMLDDKTNMDHVIIIVT